MNHFAKLPEVKNISVARLIQSHYLQVLALNSLTATRDENATAYIFALLTPLNLKKKNDYMINDLL